MSSLDPKPIDPNLSSPPPIVVENAARIAERALPVEAEPARFPAFLLARAR